MRNLEENYQESKAVNFVRKEKKVDLDWYLEQIFKGLPSWIAIPIVIFLGILLIIWLLLPLWVIFIQWNTGKIRDEIRNLLEYLERMTLNERDKIISGPKD